MVEIDIPYNFVPRWYQEPVYDAVVHQGVKRGVCVWHRRAGKDKTLINIMVAMMHQRVGTYYYFFPTFKQGRLILWNGMDRDGFPFLAHIPKEIRDNTLKQEMQITLKNGSIFQVIGTDDIDRIVGSNPVGCIFSEFALQKPEAWDYVRPILRENNGWALFNSTPRGLNHFWDIYQIATKQDDWYCEHLSIKDTGILDESDMEREREEGMSENLIRQEYYCDFTASTDDALIPMDIIIPALGKVIHPSLYEKAPRVLGVDVARFGDDKSVIIKRQGLAAFDLKKFHGLDNMQLAGVVAQEINRFKPHAVFIDAGRGEGVIDRLRQLDYEVIEVNFGGKAAESNKYYNKRAEMWARTGKWLAAGGSIPDDVELRTQLGLVTYYFDPQDRIRLLSKDKMKEVNGISPDCGDALALTHAEPVAVVDPLDVLANRQKTAIINYDLFGRQ